MNTLWSYFWPVLATGFAIGLIVGTIAFHRARTKMIVAFGVTASLAAAALWHGPGGAAGAFEGRVERSARVTLDDWEMNRVEARLGRGPLSRQLILSGPADDFQRGELVRIMSELPGVGRATWSPADRALPLIAEAALAALIAYLTGLLLAYLVALRRRYNAQWEW